MTDDGKVLIQCGTQDLGTGTYTILTQIAAQELGVSPAMVRVEIADTILPPAPNSGGSTSAASAGSAVQEAARSLRIALLELGEFGSVPIKVRNGRVSPATGGGNEFTYADLLKRAGKTSLEREVTLGRTGSAGKDMRAGFSCQAFGAQFCEVEVDPEMLMLRVTRWTGAFAIGKVLNELTLTSQLRGGIIFGIGMGLLEETMPDPTYARFVQSNLADYHLPIQMDVPEKIDVIIVEERDDHVNPIGAKGAGEIGVTGAAAAIANAVFNATGKRIRDLPIRLDKLL
jgi:xanthine dehydrogenase YagR molybdenum-binding subunit